VAAAHLDGGSVDEHVEGAREGEDDEEGELEELS